MRLAWSALLLAVGCDGGKSPTSPNDSFDPDLYEFPSRFDGEDSVNYDGQVLRQVLIAELSITLDALSGRIDAGYAPAPGDVRIELDRFFRFSSRVDGQVPLRIQTDPSPLQQSFDDLSTEKDLVGKLAGNDPIGQHVDWTAGVSGWEGSPSPEALLTQWFDEVDAAAVARVSGTLPAGSDGVVLPVTVGTDGVDRRQLIEKFLRVAVSFSQGADDYLDDADEGKGLLADHVVADGADNFTALEHAWDEGFGYFGASRTLGAWSDELVATGWSDEDGDGRIDLSREAVFGHAGNASKRDLDSVVPTDFSHEAWEGFHAGRALITSVEGPLSDADLDVLRGHRDRAVSNWEMAIAASAVHYINEVLGDMSKFGSEDYVFLDHAKHWSEMKGFALGPQFNPSSPLDDASFERLHELLRDRPALPEDADTAAYEADLLEARSLLATAYAFDEANVEAW